MIHYQDDEFLFAASSIEATFSDAKSYEIHNRTIFEPSSNIVYQLNNLTIHSSTPIGDQLVLANDDSSDQRIVKLVLIQPDRDWRQNQTYRWKLDNAWMSDPDNNNWLHWNVESFVDSIIQVPDDDNRYIFACDKMEFHFSPLGLKHYYDPVVTSTKLVLRDVRMGARFSSSNSKIPETPYIPCTPSISCSVVDGVIAGGIIADSVGTAFWKTGAAAFGAMILLLLASISWCWCRRRRRFELYEQLSPTPDEDLFLSVEDDDSYQGSSAPAESTIPGTTNETG